MTAAAVAALAAAAATAVVAVAYALFALVRDPLGPAGAAAVVAGAAAFLMLVGALILGRRPKPLRREEQGFIPKIIEFAREQPVVAAGAALAVSVIALRNPKILAAVISAFVAGQTTKKN